jgi:tetratricopeptide (TPR) repeat protein
LAAARTSSAYVNAYLPTVLAGAPVLPRELNYALPIELVTTQQVAQQDQYLIQQAMALFERARLEFKQGMYASAQADAERAIRLVPNDPTMHEFRALCQFARGQYQEAAATIYAVLSTGPGSDWNTIGALYPNPDVYSLQLRALEDTIRGGGNESWRHFLLAYQYMVLGERDAALGEFRVAASLNDRDQLSPRICELLERGGSVQVPPR